jgi:Ca2+-binding RTX toxin-like protein
MRALFLLPLLLLAAPSSALAGTATFHNGDFKFTAAPGEWNHLDLRTTTSCDGLAAPCLQVSDRADLPLAAPPECVDAGFVGIRCPLPRSVTIDAGDGLDFVNDWDGPSRLAGGAGEDVVRGRGGDDVLAGEESADVVIGGPGDDLVSGGPGNDTLESYVGGLGLDGGITAADTAGTDTLTGGEGFDAVSYEARTDPLTITIDGNGNDGGRGEGDDVVRDVESVRGGWAADSITGSPRAERLAGFAGNDALSGGGGGDNLDGGEGDDTVSGGSGSDVVAGGAENDVVDGGPGGDQLYGEYRLGCAIWSCASGDDVIRARDGEADFVECGDGDDRATVDRTDVLDMLRTCDAVAASSPCAAVRGAARRVCRILERAVAPCGPLVGRVRAACLRRAARKARASCRRSLHGRARARCERSVRRVLRP